jgi:hypothetical protein
MEVAGLAIPEALVALLDKGCWPSNAREATLQNLRVSIPPAAVTNLAADERSIYLYPPPFGTVAGLWRTDPPGFWEEMGAVHQLDPDKAVVIADFGIGSDAPILLDYRDDPGEPRLVGLKWAEPYPAGNHWVPIARNFAEFAEALDLASLNFRQA